MMVAWCASWSGRNSMTPVSRSSWWCLMIRM